MFKSAIRITLGAIVGVLVASYCSKVFVAAIVSFLACHILKGIIHD